MGKQNESYKHSTSILADLFSYRYNTNTDIILFWLLKSIFTQISYVLSYMQ